MTLPSLLSDRPTRRASIIAIAILTLAVPLIVWAAATIPAGCTTPGDCEDLTPTFKNLTVKELLRGSGALVIEEGANIDGTTFVVDDVNNRVGIGTVTPASLITAKGSIGTFKINDEGYVPTMTRSNAFLRFAGFNLGALQFSGTADNFATEQIGAVIRSLTEGNGANLWQDAPAAGLAFDTTANSSGAQLTERMRISAAGLVGIGTTTPSEKLEVVGTVSGSVLKANDLMHLQPRSSAPGSPSAGDLYFDSDSDELCLYDGSSWTGLKAAGACS